MEWVSFYSPNVNHVSTWYSSNSMKRKLKAFGIFVAKISYVFDVYSLEIQLQEQQQQQHKWSVDLSKHIQAHNQTFLQ